MQNLAFSEVSGSHDIVIVMEAVQLKFMQLHSFSFDLVTCDNLE